jgi:hypothetical protein
MRIYEGAALAAQYWRDESLPAAQKIHYNPITGAPRFLPGFVDA